MDRHATGLRAGAFVALSVALHLGVILVAREVPWPETSPAEPSWVEFAIDEGAEPAPAAAPAEVAIEESTPAPPQSATRVRSRRPAAVIVAEPSGPSASSEAPAVEPEVAVAPAAEAGSSAREAEPNEQSCAVRPGAIDARAAALTLAGDPSFNDDEPEPAAERAERDLDAHLAGQVTKQYLSERAAPRLRHRSDGSYTFRGHVFRAEISPEGEVQFFRDEGGLDFDTDPERNVATAGVRFDITDMVMRANGEEPYRYEREWFMNATEELRDRLSAQARRRELSTALVALETQVERIWHDERASAVVRRRRLFELWDQCAEDDYGAAARRVVLRFIEQELPAESADAYPASEIASLNRRRVSETEFRPYA